MLWCATLLELQKFTLTEKTFVKSTSLVKSLFSRNICQKSVITQVNSSCNFYCILNILFFFFGRPYSIETKPQEQCLIEFEKILGKQMETKCWRIGFRGVNTRPMAERKQFQKKVQKSGMWKENGCKQLFPISSCNFLLFSKPIVVF